MYEEIFTTVSGLGHGGEDEGPLGNSQSDVDSPSLSPCLLPISGWERKRLGMVAACFLRNLYSTRPQPICFPFMQQEEMRQSSVCAHTYFKSFVFFLGLFSLFF